MLQFNTFNLPPSLLLLLPEPCTGALPSAAVAAAELAPLPPAPSPPVDWSLKTFVLLLAPEPLRAYEEAGLASAGTRCQALRSIAGGRPAESGLQVSTS